VFAEELAVWAKAGLEAIRDGGVAVKLKVIAAAAAHHLSWGWA
jgi:hypothetical protein